MTQGQATTVFAAFAGVAMTPVLAVAAWNYFKSLWKV